MDQHQREYQAISHSAKRAKRCFLGRLCSSGPRQDQKKTNEQATIGDRNLSEAGSLGQRHGVAELMLLGSFCICGLSHTDNIPVFPQHSCT